jgi:hypothetical protein
VLDIDIPNMHRLEIRELRFRLQQQLGKLEDGAEKVVLEARISAIQAACPHASSEEGDEGWRCRDCDLKRAPEPVAEQPAGEDEATAAAASGDTEGSGD